jgi:Glutamyl- and glutaminyl-tRNA synthetases
MILVQCQGCTKSDNLCFESVQFMSFECLTLDLVMPAFIRTRFAPTPSGYLHLGNVFSFAITAALARRSGARILLRIDDLDQARVKRSYVEDVFDTLAFLKFPWDEGPKNYLDYKQMYSQIHRMTLYEEALQQLRRQGRIFACECSRSALLANHPEGVYTGTCRNKGIPLDDSGYNWRINTSDVELPPAMQYFVVRKRDGFPAYQLASVVDDVYYGVDLIVRGEDLRESTQAQRYLAGLLGYDSFMSTTFYHHVLLTDTASQKLSKSSGATSIQYLRRQGQTPADIYRKIGQVAGLQTTVSSWEQLAASIPDNLIKN